MQVNYATSDVNLILDGSKHIHQSENVSFARKVMLIVSKHAEGYHPEPVRPSIYSQLIESHNPVRFVLLYG